MLNNENAWEKNIIITKDIDKEFHEFLENMYKDYHGVRIKTNSNNEINSMQQQKSQNKDEDKITKETKKNANSKAENKNNTVVSHPDYYQGKRECIEEMKIMFGDRAVKNFCICSAYKYKFRAGKKDDNSKEQDLAKAEWYLSYAENM